MHRLLCCLLTPALLGALTALPSGVAHAGPALRSEAARPAPRPYADDPGIDLSIRKVLHEARTGKPIEPTPLPHGSVFKVMTLHFKFRCAAGPCWYNGVGVATYPTAWFDLTGGWRALRFGIGLAGAGEGSQEREIWWQHNFMLEGQIILGLQYPWHLTPYFEFTVGLGAMHQNLYNQDTVEFAYSFGFTAGLEWYIYHRFNIGLAVGWRRSVVESGNTTLFADSVFISSAIGF